MFAKGVFFIAAIWYGFFLSMSHAMPPLKDDRIKIAIIDTGTDLTEQIKPYLCRGGHISLTDKDPLTDNHKDKHGTNIAYLVTQNLDPKKYCVLIIKFYDESKDSGYENLANMIFGIKYAAQLKVDYLNISGGGMAPSDMEARALVQALNAGVKIAVAAGNEKTDLGKTCSFYPACYDFKTPNFHVVSSSTTKLSNYGGVAKFKEDGNEKGIPVNSGSSQATAIHLNKWIRGEVN